jgi:predicted nucleic acid-binding protein
MARYLIDTSTLIDYSKSIEPVRTRFLDMVAGGDVLGICPIQLTEFYGGLSLPERQEFESFISGLRYWDISPVAAIRASIYRYDFARKGFTISVNDAITAAVAWDEQATVITDNAKHFPMPEVTTLSLRNRS